jgi:hypothetical protein
MLIDIDRSLNLVVRQLPETLKNNLKENMNHFIESYLKVVFHLQGESLIQRFFSSWHPH